MSELPLSPTAQLDLSVRCGCRLHYATGVPTPLVLNLKPQHDTHQLILTDNLRTTPTLDGRELVDEHGNILQRLLLQPGINEIIYDAIACVPSASEDTMHRDVPVPPQDFTADLLRYTMPSRYCDSDKLRDFAWQQFGHCQQGLERIHAITDWVHRNIEYRAGSGSPQITAHDVIERGYGVCRDFAHCGVALCRTFNVPARYVSGFVPDIACFDPGTPMDFHAYFEVFMGGQWQVFDARFNTPRTGRIRIASGLDAATCAFSTCYGAASLQWFEVWSYQIDPEVTRLGDPVDLSQRLCGTPEIRRKASQRMAMAA